MEKLIFSLLTEPGSVLQIFEVSLLKHTLVFSALSVWE